MYDDAELELFQRELQELTEANQQGIQSLVPFIMFDETALIRLRLDCVVTQLFPEEGERLKFELYFQSRLAEQISKGRDRIREAKGRPTVVEKPGLIVPPGTERDVDGMYGKGGV